MAKVPSSKAPHGCLPGLLLQAASCAGLVCTSLQCLLGVFHYFTIGLNANAKISSWDQMCIDYTVLYLFLSKEFSPQIELEMHVCHKHSLADWNRIKQQVTIFHNLQHGGQ